MKSFKAIVNESAKPTNPQDRAVVDAHTVEVTPHPTAGDEVFKGLKKEKAKRRNDKNVAAQAAISESDELTEDPTQEKPMMMNALRSMSHALQGVARYVQSTQDPEEWFQNKLAGVAKEMQTLYSFATAETMGGMQENKKAALAKEIAKAGESSKKGKKAVSLKKAPWDKKEDMDPCPDCGEVHEGSCGMSEGTWALPDTPKKKAELKKLLSKPLKAKDAAAKLNKLVGDDDLHDEIYDLAKKSPNDDVRPTVKMFLQDAGIKENLDEDANIQLDELTAEEKKLLNQMYDKKGNLTAIGKKVMAAGSKNLKAGYIKAGYNNLKAGYIKAGYMAALKAGYIKAGYNEEVENEEVELDERARQPKMPKRRNGRKGAPKMTGAAEDEAKQRAKDRAHADAMGRTPSGRKKASLRDDKQVDEVLDTPKAMASYKSKAKAKSDKARNSATAKVVRGDKDISKEKNTIRKREKGLDMADRNTARKFRKQYNKEEVELDESATMGAVAKTMSNNKAKSGSGSSSSFDADAYGAELKKKFANTSTKRPKPVKLTKAQAASSNKLRAEAAIRRHESDMADHIKQSKSILGRLTGSNAKHKKAIDLHKKAIAQLKTSIKSYTKSNVSKAEKASEAARTFTFNLEYNFQQEGLQEAKMTSAQKDKFDKLYKELEGGKEHKALRVKIGNRIKADDAFHAMVKKMAMESVDEVKETVLPTHIQEMKDLNVKAGMITLGDGSKVKVSKDDLAALTKMTKGLSNNNRKSMLKSALENKKTFADMIAFAKEV